METSRTSSRSDLSSASRYQSACVSTAITHGASEPLTQGIRLLLALGLLAGLFGCGPSPSGDPSSSESSAGASNSSGSQNSPAASSAPIAGTAGITPPPIASAAPAPPEKPLIVPTWMAVALKDPDVQVRLQALDTWVRQGRTGSVDPLMLALTDSDDRVRARALALIEQDWVAGRAVQPKTTP